VLYGRADCCLCDDLALELGRLGVSFAKVDVDADATLGARYGARVPVLMAADGRELTEGRFDPADLRVRLGLE
jgi:hypothetical protein